MEGESRRPSEGSHVAPVPLELLGLRFLNVPSAHVSGFQSTVESLGHAHMWKHRGEGGRGAASEALGSQKLGG